MAVQPLDVQAILRARNERITEAYEAYDKRGRQDAVDIELQGEH